MQIKSGSFEPKGQFMQEWNSTSSDAAEVRSSAPYLYGPSGTDSDEFDSDHFQEPWDPYDDRDEEFDLSEVWESHWETIIDFETNGDAEKYFEVVELVNEYYEKHPQVGLRKISGLFKRPIEEIADILVRWKFRPPVRSLWERKIELAEVLRALSFSKNYEEILGKSRGNWDWSSLGGKFEHGIHSPAMGISGIEFLIVRIELGLAQKYTRVDE